MNSKMASAPPHHRQSGRTRTAARSGMPSSPMVELPRTCTTFILCILCAWRITPGLTQPAGRPTRLVRILTAPHYSGFSSFFVTPARVGRGFVMKTPTAMTQAKGKNRAAKYPASFAVTHGASSSFFAGREDACSFRPAAALLGTPKAFMAA